MKCSELQKVSREDGGAALYIGKRDTNSTQTPCSACIYLLLVIACPFDKQFFLYPCVTFSSSDREYLCLGKWEEDGLLYTYTRRIHNPRHECFVGRVTISSLESTSKPHFRLRGREGFYLQRAGPTVVGDSGWTCSAWSFQREVVKSLICCVLIFFRPNQCPGHCKQSEGFVEHKLEEEGSFQTKNSLNAEDSKLFGWEGRELDHGWVEHKTSQHWLPVRGGLFNI